MASPSSSQTPAPTSTEKPFSRFDLPGLNLPLNWQPCGTHQEWRWEGPNYVQFPVPARGEGKALLRSVVNDIDVESGYASYVLFLDFDGVEAMLIDGV